MVAFSMISEVCLDISSSNVLHPWVSSDSGLHLLDPVHRAPSHGTSQTQCLGCRLIKFSRLHLITLDNKFIKNANYTTFGVTT